MMDTRRRARRRAEETTAVSVETRSSGVPAPQADRVSKAPVEVAEPPAYVRVEGSVTQNLGDYNSVRVGVCIERPCDNNDAAIEATYQDLSGRVDSMIQRELDVAVGGQ